ncbi:MAG: pyrroline-5-carboxylate reductase [Maricaulaceae bacterium]
MTKHTHLIIGAGRMGGALMQGWIKGRRPTVLAENIVILDPTPGEAAQQVLEAGASHVTRISASMKSLTHVILAIKPQMFDAIAPSLEAYIPKTCVIVSIMAGVSLQRLSLAFPQRPLVRCMPNTPAAIGAGITAFTTTESVSKDQKKIIAKLLTACGRVQEVETENMIDIVTAVSGSGPAYIFYMVEALEGAAINAGMPGELASIFARETIIGSAALLKKTDQSAEALRIAVTSPGGTTQAALDRLMSETGLAPLMTATVRAALKRAKELS